MTTRLTAAQIQYFSMQLGMVPQPATTSLAQFIQRAHAIGLPEDDPVMQELLEAAGSDGRSTDKNAPAPTPLTSAQIRAIEIDVASGNRLELAPTDAEAFARAIERAHGIGVDAESSAGAPAENGHSTTTAAASAQPEVPDTYQTNNGATVRRLPGVAERVETGPVQFGDDWPGLFVRGDRAYAMAGEIRMVLESLDRRGFGKTGSGLSSVLIITTLWGLVKLLASPSLVPIDWLAKAKEPGAPDPQ